MRSSFFLLRKMLFVKDEKWKKPNIFLFKIHLCVVVNAIVEWSILEPDRTSGEICVSLIRFYATTKKCVTASFKLLYILSTSNILCDTTASEIKTKNKPLLRRLQNYTVVFITTLKIDFGKDYISLLSLFFIIDV